MEVTPELRFKAVLSADKEPELQQGWGGALNLIAAVGWE